jgi:phosphatidylserine decarboxylase
MRLELAWGRLRRAYLRRFRSGYLERMRGLRQGDCDDCRHEILDPRDLKFVRNVCGYWWAEQDDPFAWRDRLPLVRAGLAEVLILGGGSLLLAALLGWYWWPAGVAVLGLAAWVVSFFRNPRREPPKDAQAIVAPADGRIVSIERVEDAFVGPAISVGIFLSIFNVHVNRSPIDATVVGQRYLPGKFFNALRPESARENERLELCLRQTSAPFRRLRVAQITGALARRIVCWTAPGRDLKRGEAFGMIKLGSRTELVLPEDEGLQLLVEKGTQVRAGVTVIARFQPEVVRLPDHPVTQKEV